MYSGTTMERTDSSSAMMLLQYGNDDSDEDTSFNEQSDTQQTKTESEKKTSVEKKSPEKKHRHSIGKESEPLSPSRRASEDSIGRQSAGLISDEEVDHHLPERFRKRTRDEEEAEEETLSAVPAKVRLMDVKIAPPVSPIDVDSGASLPDSQRSKGGKKSSKREPAMPLVSYGTDDLDDDDDDDSQSGSEESSSEGKEEDLPNEEPSASPGPKGPVIEAEDIQLPPEPPGKCSKVLQEKITHLYNRMKQQGFDTNHEIQRLTSFRNPSIYEKLIHNYHIDEKGSNFKPEVFNPNMWGKDSFYDELDKLQKKDMERREKDRKTKIEFISGTKKSAPSSDHSHSAAAISDDKKRKSKWDALPAGLPTQQPMHRSGSGSNMAAANLTTSASGTRATVISAVGTLTKKAPYNVINSSGAAYKS